MIYDQLQNVVNQIHKYDNISYRWHQCKNMIRMLVYINLRFSFTKWKKQIYNECLSMCDDIDKWIEESLKKKMISISIKKILSLARMLKFQHRLGELYRNNIHNSTKVQTIK